MFCRFCGKKLPEDSVFCSKCGKGIADGPEEENKARLTATVQSTTPRKAVHCSTQQLREEGENGQIEIYEDKVTPNERWKKQFEEIRLKIQKYSEKERVFPDRNKRILISIFVVGIIFAVSSVPIGVFFFFLLLLSLFCLIVGLIKPEKVYLFGRPKTRLNVFLIYFLLSFALFAAVGESPKVGKDKAGPSINQSIKIQENNPLAKEIQVSNQQNFRPVYRVISDEDMTVGNYVRRSVKIVVPLGLSREAIEANLKHAAYAVYDKSRTNAVMVFAYREDDQDKSTYTAGRCVLAPNVYLARKKCIEWQPKIA